MFRQSLRIAFVVTNDIFRGTDGTGRVIYDISSRLVEKGHFCHIYVPKLISQHFFNFPKNIEFRQYDQESVPLFFNTHIAKFLALFSRNSDRRRYFRRKSERERLAFQLSEAFRRYPPADLVIAKSPFDGIVAMDALNKLSRRTPVIAMVHTAFERVMDQIYPRLKATDTSKYDTVLKSDGLWREHLRISDLISTFRAVQVLLPATREEFLNLFPKANVALIPNIVPQYSFQSSLVNPRIIYTGRISPEKRLDLLIRAFARICRNFPEWRLELWGSLNNKKYTKALSNLIENLRISTQVLIRGETKTIETVLSASSIFAFPSSCEGWGLALTEAMSAGLAVLGCNDAPGVRDLICSNENGILCDPTEKAIGDSLTKLISDISFRRKLGLTAKNSVREYTSERVWSQWEVLIDEISP